jgi:hypothetical protein
VIEMRKLIEATPVSLDGVVGSSREWSLARWDDVRKAYPAARGCLTASTPERNRSR